MKRVICLIALLAMVACGAKVDHSGYVKHESVFNVESMEKLLDHIEVYFRANCQKEMELLNPTEGQIETCVAVSMGAFLKAFQPPSSP